jgi:RNA polymerase sigma-70 factor (ECF subfamily)
MRLLYERHADALFSFVRAQLIDQFDAADAVQEAFLEVWRTAARFAGHSSVRTWLFSIALNKAVDLRRRRARVVPGDAEASLVDDAQCPHALLQAARDAAVVRACISRLSDRHRSAIHLAFYEELSYHDIAAIEGVPVGTIRTRIHHAKRLLKRRLTAAATGARM